MTTALNKSLDIVKRKLAESASARSAFNKTPVGNGPTGLGENEQKTIAQPDTLITDSEGIEMNPDLSEYE